MKNILVTGSAGFIGKNLITNLSHRGDLTILTFDKDDSPELLEEGLASVDIVFHLAGINRPDDVKEFQAGNVDLTNHMISLLKKHNNYPKIILTSSIQADLNNPYGISKKQAEDVLTQFGDETGSDVYVYRLPNVFGKWSRPNYNTVVATFCHNIIRGIDIKISDPDHKIELVYIDDVVEEFSKQIDATLSKKSNFIKITKTFKITLGDLAKRLYEFNDIRDTLLIPDMQDELNRNLYATFLSFMPENKFSYPAVLNTDHRGWLFELIKSKHFGQIFVSKTHPGITRGDHYHDTKIEKFCLISGRGIIRFRSIFSNDILEYVVDDDNIQIVDIPPGYTHSIENTGTIDMIVLFWADQIFNPSYPDTNFDKVLH